MQPYISTLYSTFLYILCVLSLTTVCTYGQPPKGTIVGKVTTSDGKPVAAATVVIKGSARGATTDDKGRCTFSAPAGTYRVVASAVGFLTQEVQVSILSGKATTVSIVLEENIHELTEVVVNGNKTDQYVAELPSQSLRLNAPLIEIPQNISVVTRQTMKDFGVTGTAEMSRMTSGIIKRYGGANDFAFTIRGTDATNNVFRNGVGGYWWNQQADAFMLDRVEFVKGPAGFMIGNAEPGGLLNEVTKQADGNRIREIELGYGSWNLMRAGVDFGGKFSDKSKFSYRVVAGGQFTNANYDFYYATRTYLLPSVRYSYRNGSFIQLEMSRMDGFVKADNSSNISFTGSDHLLPLTFNATDPNAIRGIETDDTYIRLAHVHQLGKGWQIKTQLADVRGIYQGDGMYVTAASQHFDTLFRRAWHINWQNRLQVAQSFVDGKFHTGAAIEHSFLGGIDYGKTTVRSAYGDLIDTDTIWGNELPLVVQHPLYQLQSADMGIEMFPEDDWGTEWAALYAQDHVKFYTKLILTLAGRLSRTRSWTSWDSTTVYDTKLTPRLGLTYLISNRMSVYALYDETFLPQTGRKEDRSAPRPLTGSNLEVGYKSQFFNGKLALNASLFRTLKNNVLVQNPQTDFYVERGQILSQGFEMDMVGNLTSSLSINANYTYTDARITKDHENPDNVGFRNYGVAPHTGNAMLRYQFQQGILNGFSVGVGVQLMGSRSAVWTGDTEAQDKDKVAPFYTLYDANIGYQTRKFTLHLNVYNLFNKRYMDSAWWNSAIVDEDIPANSRPGFFTYSPGQPINFRLTAGYSF